MNLILQNIMTNAIAYKIYKKPTDPVYSPATVTEAEKLKAQDAAYHVYTQLVELGIIDPKVAEDKIIEWTEGDHE